MINPINVKAPDMMFKIPAAFGLFPSAIFVFLPFI
jgi:hypothetical protein